MSKKIKKRIRELVISFILFTIALVLDITTDFAWYINLFIYLPSYIITGHSIIRKAVKGIYYGLVLDENFLMTVATIGAFIIGQFAEGVAVMILYQFGELFQTIAVKKSRACVKSLMDIRPDHANLVNGEEIIEISPEDAKIGDVIEIKPGEKIALDSIVIDGTSTINTSMLTGESLPQVVGIGDKLTSGCVNIDGVLHARVTTEYHNSTVSKILNLVEYAQEKKAKSENFITKFARVYTPIICSLALALAIIPPIFLSNWSEWLYRALCFLVVSCPCALVISVPLTFFASIGCASKNGILIKGSSYIEKLANIDTFIFDKTGTLTKGTFKILEVIPKEREDEILKLATIAEIKSTHPLSRAILEKNIVVNSNEYTYTNIIGEGIIAKNNKETILAGNEKLLKDYKIEYNNEISTTNSIIHIAKNGKYIGAIIIGDEIKEEASKVISYLKKETRVALLSGDNIHIAKNVSNVCGIDEFYYDMLPEDKINKLESIMKDSKVTAFVGDGINDSPSLTRADVGISMGKLGTDSAIEASDIVIMNDNLNNLIVANRIAKKTIKIVKQNIFFTLSVKIAILVLSVFGVSNIWWAIFGDVGISVLAILNAIRALTYKK